jgi:hypothetical protein
MLWFSRKSRRVFKPTFWRVFYGVLTVMFVLVSEFAGWPPAFAPQVKHAEAATTTPIKRVQVAGNDTFGSSIAATFSQNTQAGDLIVVCGTVPIGSGFNTPTDSQANTFQLIVAQSFGGCWYAANIAGGADTITVNTLSGSADLALLIHEYSGVATVSPLDVVAGEAIGNGTVLDSGAGTVSQSGELIFGFGGGDSLNQSTPVDLVNPGTDFSLAGQRLRAAGTAHNESIATADILGGTVGAYHADFTTNDQLTRCALLATFRPASSPGYQVSSRSDILSNSAPSATSNHTLAFTVNNAVYGSSVSGSSTITLALPWGFSPPTGLDCGDVDAATSVQFSFNYPGCQATATAWGFSATGSVLTLTPPSGTGVYVPTSTQITIKIGSNATSQQQGQHWITNPSTGGTYTVAVGGTFGGSGNIPVSINAGVTVQVSIPESLSLSVSSISALGCTADDGATVNSVSTTGPLIAFGNLSANTFYQGCHDLQVSTNAGNGYSLAVQENHAMQTSSGANSIPDTTCDAGTCSESAAAAWTNATKNGLGHTCFNQSNHDCNAAYSSGTNFRQFANIAGGETAQAIMSSSTPAIATGRVKYRLSVPSSQAPGTYTNTIVYTITATY